MISSEEDAPNHGGARGIRLSALVPVYNEAETIEEIVRDRKSVV